MRTVLITGANRGLGKALVAEFAETYNLILHSRSPLAKMPVNAVNLTGDIRKPKTIANLADLAQRVNLNILINNAGVYLSKPFAEVAETEIREAVETNLIAPLLLTRAIWPVFAAKRSGMVININSLASWQGGEGEAVYSAAKAGLRGFSETVQYDATRDGIRVLNVNIGGMNTDIAAGRPDRDKLIHPQDAARAIFNLCMDYRSLRITSLDLKRRNY